MGTVDSSRWESLLFRLVWYFLIGAALVLAAVIGAFYLLSEPIPAGGSAAGLALPSSSRAADLRITIPERRLTQGLRDALRNDPLLADPAVDLVPPNRVRVSSTVRMQFLGRQLSMKPALVAVVKAEDGRARVEPVGLEVGELVVPPQLVRGAMEEAAGRMEESINASVDQVKSSSGYELSGVQILEDTLVLDFDEPQGGG